MVVGQDRSRARLTARRAALATLALASGGLAWGAATWCLGLGTLGPVRTGMSAEKVMQLADFSGLARRQPAEECWYLHFDGQRDADFDLMIIGNQVVRIELRGASTLRTLGGAHIGSSEEELKRLYRGIDVQPHKYDEHGHTLTYRSLNGELGLRFETSNGKVTAIQSGPWEHLHYVEGCS